LILSFFVLCGAQCGLWGPLLWWNAGVTASTKAMFTAPLALFAFGNPILWGCTPDSAYAADGNVTMFFNYKLLLLSSCSSTRPDEYASYSVEFNGTTLSSVQIVSPNGEKATLKAEYNPDTSVLTQLTEEITSNFPTFLSNIFHYPPFISGKRKEYSADTSEAKGTKYAYTNYFYDDPALPLQPTSSISNTTGSKVEITYHYETLDNGLISRIEAVERSHGQISTEELSFVYSSGVFSERLEEVCQGKSCPGTLSNVYSYDSASRLIGISENGVLINSFNYTKGDIALANFGVLSGNWSFAH